MKSTTNVKFKTFASLEEAQRQAGLEAVNVGGYTFPITVFRQGERTNLCGAFPIKFIIHQLKANPTERGKGVIDVREASNRPFDPDHAKATREYLIKNFRTRYILPAMTINIQDPVNVYTVDYQGTIHPAYLVVPYTVKFSVTDGQHRKKALEEIGKYISAEDLSSLEQDGVPVMITLESAIDQMHQDFADCSKTKALPKSLIAVYDKRNPANSLVLDIIDQCILFTGKVDATSKTLSKKSIRLFLVSQIRAFVKELLLGSSAQADAELERRAYDMFGSSTTEAYRETFEKFKNFVNEVTEQIPVLKQVTLLKEATELSQIPLLREKSLILNSAGLNIVGRIGHEIFRNAEKYRNWKEYTAKLGDIDWLKEAEMWRGNIVQEGMKGLKISTSNSTLKSAFEKVKIEIGMEEREKREVLLTA